jgi:hypothetical protein
MHFCRAKIAIGDDSMNVFNAAEFDPVSWPEILVLQLVHGETAITDVEPFATVNQSSREERMRLSEKYKETVVSEVFGGRQGPNEMEAPGVSIVPGIVWFNPITRRTEVTGGNGHAAPDYEPEQPPEELPEFEPIGGGGVVNVGEPVTPRAPGGRFAARK